MNSRFSAVLLAGGRSTRMGADKAFIEIDGVPLWRRQLDVLQQLKPAELFIAGPAHREWQEMGCVVIPDAQPDAGPMAGLVAALRRCSAHFLLAVAVDLPNITSDYLRELVASCSETCGVVPHDTERFEPLIAAYPLRALPIAESCLARRDLSLQRFAALCLSEGLVKVKDVHADDRMQLFNMNTPDDLMTAAADASHKVHQGSQRKADRAASSPL